MKTRHSFPVKPQITVKEGMVLFLARTTNLARLGMSAGEGSITVEEFIRRFCPRRAGDVVSMKKAGGRWLFNVGAPANFKVNTIQLQRLNDLTEDERANEDQPSNITFQRRDNPFLFVLGITWFETEAETAVPGDLGKTAPPKSSGEFCEGWMNKPASQMTDLRYVQS